MKGTDEYLNSDDIDLTLNSGAANPKAPRGQLFEESSSAIVDFRFDGTTASVFDDMVNRSVPFYDEMQRMTGEIAADFATPASNLFDLGCATGTTLLSLDSIWVKILHNDDESIG